jgi:hypothetical protein
VASSAPLGSTAPANFAQPKPTKILDRSANISHWEDDLAHALVISVIDDVAASNAGAIARRFEVEETELLLRPLGPASFLLILLGLELMEQIYNGGRPIITSTLRLHVMR